jgi:light-regulated signal transduction histidine kinase (bacteriophytochrome)
MMPEMDGFTFITEVRKHADWNNIPIILLSARAGQEATVEGLQKGANDYLVKPFYAQELVARVKTQLEIKRRTLELDIVNKELEQFAYAASHDLQEPLRKIMMFAEKLEYNLMHKTEDALPYLKKITASSQKMKTLIIDLLNFSRLSHIDQEFRPTDLNSVIDTLKEDLELTILQKEARIECDPLPVIEAIPLQMNQLFYNLISNALKFTQAGRQPNIKIQCQQLGENEINHFPELNRPATWYRIDVIDNGVGFEQKYADYIFSLFKRLHSNDSYMGTGIGLSLCKKIVVAHKGKIFATAEKDRGAVFTLILPEKRS